MSKLQLIAVSVFGTEAITARELKKLGYFEQKVEDGKVTFTGDKLAICRTNIWLRTASRVQLKIGDFKAYTFDELFEQTKALPWDEIIPVNAEFPVVGYSINSKLFSVSDCQAIVKKAIVEKLKQKYKCEWFEESGPRYKIEVAILKDTVTLSIDTSGAGLHKRGYRKLVGGAPIKETLASAMLLISHWNKDRVLLDPMCGSGTIPVEAAMIAKNIAPGLGREFESEKWDFIPQDLWDEARDEAYDAIIEDIDLRIHGSDIDEEAISLARYHAKKAGVEDAIHLQRMPVSDISSRYKYGVIMCNPPYGERLGEMDYVKGLYKEMGKVFRKFDTWSYYVISSDLEFEKHFGKKADKKRKLYNGSLLCNFYQYFGPPPPKNTNMLIT
ncbi:class I SAM-dependent RNA methyltransferase [Ruminiclostridium herbifermentans]|uniref:Class I SAM-dependent RNA methyltransferase n=1 Tax=Ruminiclostridium herbifermentans TaxID=2488810 RepID=A0A4U7JGS3_9FIRM|nr:class I SAM-dependent RNA methyltransferase [Ruminiclostridium herbifermentans]QNU67790.1 class I SAM-dependent RNA methyltransferase [Ruminiclostridium herbifermentans]